MKPWETIPTEYQSPEWGDRKSEPCCHHVRGFRKLPDKTVGWHRRLHAVTTNVAKVLATELSYDKAMSEKQTKILVAVTGGVASFKAAALVSQLAQRGHLVQVAMTPAAQRSLAPLLLLP